MVEGAARAVYIKVVPRPVLASTGRGPSFSTDGSQQATVINLTRRGSLWAASDFNLSEEGAFPSLYNGSARIRILPEIKGARVDLYA